MFRSTLALFQLNKITWRGNTYASNTAMKAVGEAAIKKHYDEHPSLEARGAETAEAR